MIYRFGIGTKFGGKILVDESTIRYVGSCEGLKKLARDMLLYNVHKLSPTHLYFPVGVIQVNGSMMYLPLHLWDKNGLKSVYETYQTAAVQAEQEMQKLGYAQVKSRYVQNCLQTPDIVLA